MAGTDTPCYEVLTDRERERLADYERDNAAKNPSTSPVEPRLLFNLRDHVEKGQSSRPSSRHGFWSLPTLRTGWNCMWWLDLMGLSMCVSMRRRAACYALNFCRACAASFQVPLTALVASLRHDFVYSDDGTHHA